MTDVRQGAASGGGAPKKTARRGAARTAAKVPAASKAGPVRNERRAASSSASSVAQVRLQSDELVELRDAMRRLSLGTTSEALRAGIRLLIREARETAAADEIQRFYGGRQAPLPEGVASATEEELAAADSAQW